MILAAFLAASSIGRATPNPAGGISEEAITIPSFGRVAIYRPQPVQRIRGIVLFVSGDGGWNLGVVDMARRAATRALVVGLSMKDWRERVEARKAGCWYPAGELESTAHSVEKIYKLPRYVRPILVGYSSGATLVYAALAQAPDDTFEGSLSLGFCPELEVALPLCGRSGWKAPYDGKRRVSLLPPRSDLKSRERGAVRWTALQGEVDQVCSPKTTEEFVGRIPSASVVPLPRVGHGFSVPRNWGRSFDEALGAMLHPASPWEAEPAAPGPPSAAGERPSAEAGRLEALGLPLEVAWPEGAREVLVFVSGDGGWAELDQAVAKSLGERGVAVIGWNALRYFWEPKKRAEFRADLLRLVQALPEKQRVFVGGYSFGAEVVPAALGRNPGQEASALSRIAGMVLVAPGSYATYEVSPLDWMRSREKPTRHPVRKLLEAGGELPVLCLEPSDDEESGCPDRPLPGITRVVMPGGHHFAGDYARLADRIVQFLEVSPRTR